jgi:hypothetical protein
MTDTAFTTPEESATEWTDVRMTDPEAGEWDIDVVVAGGRVEYVDLRVRPALLAGFVECLVDDVDDERAREILRSVADRRGLELDGSADEPAE